MASAQSTEVGKTVKIVDTTAKDNDDPYDALSYFMVGLDYINDNVYMGRRDSSRIPYISPYVGYVYKDGLYARVLVSLSPDKGRVDLVTAEAGYDHTFGQHINIGGTLDKYYYHQLSENVRASQSGVATVYGQYSNDYVEPQLNLSSGFANKTDFALGVLIDHDFMLVNNTLNIFPAVATNYGTQNYYDEYFKKKFRKNDKLDNVEMIVTYAKNFKVLVYEVSARVTYRVGTWLFTFVPTYAIPLSPATITIPKKPVERESLSNVFYMELDICHR